MVKLDAEERALLEDAHAGREIVGESVNGVKSPRYVVATALTDKGLLRWARASGKMGRGAAHMRVTYQLTPEGQEVARVVCAS